jgi:hypothetical protein
LGKTYNRYVLVQVGTEKSWELEDVISPRSACYMGKGCFPQVGGYTGKGYIHPNGTLSKVNKIVESGCYEKPAEIRIMEMPKSVG